MRYKWHFNEEMFLSVGRPRKTTKKIKKHQKVFTVGHFLPPQRLLSQTILWEGCHLTGQLPQTAPWERFPEKKLGKQGVTSGKAFLVGYFTAISGNDRLFPHPTPG